jgi:hypothetical protein
MCRRWRRSSPAGFDANSVGVIVGVALHCLGDFNAAAEDESSQSGRSGIEHAEIAGVGLVGRLANDGRKGEKECDIP